MEDYPKITICIPTYNRIAYLKKAIDSAISQDYANFEIVVSDNCSNDGTRGLLEEYCKYVKNFKYFVNTTNVGMVGNWNLTLHERIDSEWFIILSDDDYITDSTYLTKISLLIQSNPNLSIVFANGLIEYTRSNEFHELRLPFKTVENGVFVFLNAHKTKPQAFTLCNVVFRKSLALKFDAFNNKYNLACDSELFLKSCLYGQVGVIHDNVSVYRIHGNNLITQTRSSEQLKALAEDLLMSPYMESRKVLTDSEMIEQYFNEVVLSGLKDIFFNLKLINREEYLLLFESLVKQDSRIRLIKNDKKFLLKMYFANFSWLVILMRKLKGLWKR